MDFLGLGSAFRHTFFGDYSDVEKKQALDLQDRINDKYKVEQAREQAWESLKNMTGQEKENNIIGIFVIMIGGLLALSLFQK